jgi:hypothetical protein
VVNRSQLPDLLPDVDNRKNTQKTNLFYVDFVFHKSVDKLLIPFLPPPVSGLVDNFVDNPAHVVHNLLMY